jgi:NADH-quinone oxidoreductase subunit L
VAAIGIATAWRLFGVRWLVFRRDPDPARVAAITASSSPTRFLYRASLNKWWFDDLNHLLFIEFGGRVANLLWWFDRVVIDGSVNGLGTAVSDAGRGLRRVQTGRVQNYALGIALGLLVMAGSYLVIASR